MNELFTIVKKNRIEVIIILALNFNQFFLFDSSILGLLSVITNLTLSTLFLRQREHYHHSLETEVSAMAFFLSFAEGLKQGKTGKSAYDSACRYLTGYQTYTGFEEEVSTPSLNLFCMEDYYSFLLEKERTNQLSSLCFDALMDKAKQKRETLEQEKKKEERKDKAALALLLLFSLLFHVLYSFLTEYDLSSSYLYLITTFLFSTLSLPLLYLVEKENYRGLCYVR